MKVNIFEIGTAVGVKVNGKTFSPCEVRITEAELFFEAERRREEINAM